MHLEQLQVDILSVYQFQNISVNIASMIRRIPSIYQTSFWIIVIIHYHKNFHCYIYHVCTNLLLKISQRFEVLIKIYGSNKRRELSLPIYIHEDNKM